MSKLSTNFFVLSKYKEKKMLPMKSVPSSGAGCYGDHWRVHAKSSSGKADSRGTAGIDSEIPSCSHSGSMSIQQDGRLNRNEMRVLVTIQVIEHTANMFSHLVSVFCSLYSCG